MGGGCVGFSTEICQHGHLSYLVNWSSVSRHNQVAGNRAASASTDSPADTFQPGFFAIGLQSQLDKGGFEIAHRHLYSASQPQKQRRSNQMFALDWQAKVSDNSALCGPFDEAA
ncbi:uncharacterized protein TrAtP1_003270 [Trichoderma atroviride]|uniref:uncharacterized protein n=1 Tax=Hypocrea atroviridis TaxID=63577 RepID=UPI00331CD94F|nr:hypothetical protein TrAtP1_003270 [Trichoderma atroviride]